MHRNVCGMSESMPQNSPAGGGGSEEVGADPSYKVEICLEWETKEIEVEDTVPTQV